MRIAILSAICCIYTIGVNGQDNAAFVGTWSGKLNVGVELSIVFHIRQTATGDLSSTADSPDQASYGIKCDTTFLRNGELVIEMRALAASISGKLTSDSTISGTFKQGKEFPLTLTKGLFTPLRKRPQTPQPPFSYKSEDIVYSNQNKSIQYGATITIPQGKGPFPAILLITGSGAQNRDEEVLGHRPFAVLADALTKNGIVVLRVDDRGIAKTTGQFAGATTADFADDAEASLDYLLSRSEVDKKRTGLLGHSEGGLIAPMVAVKRKEVNFLVLLAAPAVKNLDLMTEQNIALTISAGQSKEVANAYGTIYNHIVTAILNSPNDSMAARNAFDTLTGLLATIPSEIVGQLGLNSTRTRETFINSLVEGLSNKWMRYFISIDAAPTLQQLNCKVLALNGNKDIQVVSASNIPAMRANLKLSKSKIYEVKELPGLNHLFQHCSRCTLQEYGEIEETMSPEVLDIINNWINKNVK